MEKKEYKQYFNNFLEEKGHKSLIVVNKHWNTFRWICTIIFLLMSIIAILSGNIIAQKIQDDCSISIFTIKHEITQETFESISKYLPTWKNIIQNKTK